MLQLVHPRTFKTQRHHSYRFIFWVKRRIGFVEAIHSEAKRIKDTEFYARSLDLSERESCGQRQCNHVALISISRDDRVKPLVIHSTCGEALLKTARDRETQTDGDMIEVEAQKDRRLNLFLNGGSWGGWGR